MVRSQTLPFQDYALATPGQVTWVFLNQLVDYGEKRRRVHLHCLPKFDQEVCEVCYEPINYGVPEELQDKIYRPGVDGIIPDVEIEQERAESYSDGGWELVRSEENEPDN
jgi:hypothetical protein